MGSKFISAMSAAVVVALTAGGALAASGKLVVYTSQPNKDAQQTIDAFKAENPGVEVEWFRNGTTKVMAKLRTEFAAGAPRPDILLIADLVNMEGLKREGRLLAHPGAPVGPYAKQLYDADMHYFSTKLITTGIVYNTNAPMKPKTWQDLVDVQAKGLVAMPSPLTSGAALIHMATLTRNTSLGWKYYEKLAANGIKPKGGNGGTFKAVAGGEKLYGMVVDFVPIRAKLKGSPVEFVFPKEGVSAVTEPVAILKTAKNPEAAKAFVNFLLSRKGQELASSQGYLPAHPEVAPPKGFPAVDSIKLMDFDPEDALAKSEEMKKKFVDLFGG